MEFTICVCVCFASCPFSVKLSYLRWNCAQVKHGIFRWNAFPTSTRILLNLERNAIHMERMWQCLLRSNERWRLTERQKKTTMRRSEMDKWTEESHFLRIQISKFNNESIRKQTYYPAVVFVGIFFSLTLSRLSFHIRTHNPCFFFSILYCTHG